MDKCSKQGCPREQNWQSLNINILLFTHQWPILNLPGSGCSSPCTTKNLATMSEGKRVAFTSLSSELQECIIGHARSGHCRLVSTAFHKMASTKSEWPKENWDRLHSLAGSKIRSCTFCLRLTPPVLTSYRQDVNWSQVIGTSKVTLSSSRTHFFKQSGMHTLNPSQTYPLLTSFVRPSAHCLQYSSCFTSFMTHRKQFRQRDFGSWSAYSSSSSRSWASTYNLFGLGFALWSYLMLEPVNRFLCFRQA